MIRIVVLDIDGVVTDGRMIISEEGREFKRTSFRDLDGFFALKREGFITGFVTGENSPITEWFRGRFKPDYFFSGCKDKKHAIEEILKKEQSSREELCYVGDSVHDLPAFDVAGLSVCPSDAATKVKKISDVVLSAEGGNGVVAELAEFLIQSGNSHFYGKEPKFPNLNGKRIDLIEINHTGLQDMFEYSKQEIFYRFLEFGVYKTIEETKEYLRKLINRSRTDNAHYWFIFEKSKNKIIGTFGLPDVDFRKGCAEIGYGVSPDFWGKGYFSESLKLVLDFLFVQKNFYRIWAKTYTTNNESIHALERAGFKSEGTMRGFYLSYKDGFRHDAALLGILRDEFMQKRKEK